MDDDDLKRFGFLPKKKMKKQEEQKNIGRKKSDRFYVQDVQGIYLTTREAEVSWMMAKGFTVREAADRMGLSPRTVEFYLNNVRRKLRVRYKHELLRVLDNCDFFKRWESLS